MFVLFIVGFLMWANVLAQGTDDSVYENKSDIKLAATCYMMKDQNSHTSLAYALFFEYSNYLNVTAKFIPFYHHGPGNFTLIAHQNALPGMACESLGPRLNFKNGHTPVGGLGELKWEIGFSGLPKTASLRYPGLKLSGPKGLLNHTFALYNDPPASENEKAVACCGLGKVLTPDQL